MNSRRFLIVPIALLGMAALPALAQAPATATAMPAIPPHKCVAPAYPSEGGLQKRAEAYNRAVEAFNRDHKAYGECIRKYVDETNSWGKAATDASNKAIDEWNKFAEDVRKKIEAEK